MDKVRMRLLAEESLRELKFQTWSVSTVWQKKKTNRGASFLTPINPDTDWVLDFDNNEGTFPRVLFHYKKEDGEVWVKREIKQQLIALKERALLQSWFNSNNEPIIATAAPAIRSAGVPSSPSRQRSREQQLSAPSVSASAMGIEADAGQSKREKGQTSHLENRQPAILSGANPQQSSLNLRKNKFSSWRMFFYFRPVTWASTIIVVGGLTAFMLNHQLKETGKSVSYPAIDGDQQVVDQRSPTTTPNDAPIEKAKIVVPAWPTLTSASTPSTAADYSPDYSPDIPASGGKKEVKLRPSLRSRRPVSFEPSYGTESTSLMSLAAAPSIAQSAAHADLNKAIQDWATANENQDVQKEISFYAGNVAEYKFNRNIPREDVEFDKERSLDRSKAVKVIVGTPIISSDPAGYMARVTVSKSVTNKSGEKEEAAKEIRWQKTRSGWKIVGEKDLLLAQ